MIWILLLLLAVICIVHWWEYTTTVQEYQFSQPESISDHSNFRKLLSEKTPIAIEIGSLPWRPEIVSDNSDVDISIGLDDIDKSRCWWWLPGIRSINTQIMDISSTSHLEWITAERKWLGCTHGSLTVWLVHSRYKQFLPSFVAGMDPWTLDASTTPYIGKVQFIEVSVKEGWCLGIPAHWGFAFKISDDTDNRSVWYWTGTQESLCSLAFR